jgi:hypothetical protein
MLAMHRTAGEPVQNLGVNHWKAPGWARDASRRCNRVPVPSFHYAVDHLQDLDGLLAMAIPAAPVIMGNLLAGRDPL